LKKLCRKARAGIFDAENAPVYMPRNCAATAGVAKLIPIWGSTSGEAGERQEIKPNKTILR